ncbi:MAG: DUF924 family protein [Rhizobiaceae bacterium]|nr:DUF924 family protein [Rhizobiaceae bacterium]
MTTPSDILDFWASIGKQGWWTKSDEVDQEIVARFSDIHTKAVAGDIDDWAETPDGALALIIILDQFSRNMFRGDAKTFAQDPKALELAKGAVTAGFDKQVREDLRLFFYLPYEHSEKISDQNESVLLMHSVGNEPDNMKAVLEHREIIQRFGRFPHRNAVLGRHTTPAEQAYLDGGGFKG